MLPPELLAVHLGPSPATRLRCRAKLFKDRYIADPPAPLATLSELRLPPGGITVFSAPIGLSDAYAQAVGLKSFREGLAQFGQGPFSLFYEICGVPEEITLHRPFYPQVARNVSLSTQQQIMGPAAHALRRCDVKVGADPLFWLGGKHETGRAAIACWKQVLGPRRDQIALWPFDGPLDALLQTGKPVVAELHRGLVQHRLGLDILIQFSRMPRASCGMQIYEQVKGVDFQNVKKTLLYGEGPSPQGEAEFDVLVSLIGIANLFLQNKVKEPNDDRRRVEGWMLGL